MHAAAISSSSSRPSTRPVGLCGELSSSTRARGPIAARSASASSANVRRAQRHRPPPRAGERDARRVRVVVGLEHDDLVAGVAQPEQRRRDRLGGAERDQHVLGLEPVPAALVLEHRLAQRRHARQRRVLVLAAAQRRDRGLDHRRRAVGVGEPLAEVDRPGPRRERGHLGEDRRPEPVERDQPGSCRVGRAPDPGPAVVLVDQRGLGVRHRRMGGRWSTTNSRRSCASAAATQTR